MSAPPARVLAGRTPFLPPRDGAMGEASARTLSNTGRMAGPSERGRELFEQRAWAEAFAELTRADDVSGRREVADLERLAVSAHLSGRPDEAVAAWEQAHRALLARGTSPGPHAVRSGWHSPS